MAGALAAGALACAPAPAAGASAEVTIAVLPYGTEPMELGRIDGLAPGVMSAGLSKVSPLQTYLDIGQGNRVFTSLYDREPPPLSLLGDRVAEWAEITERADSPPAEIVPGLLASSLLETGVPVRADSLLATPALMLVDREGRIERTPPLRCLQGSCAGVAAVSSTVDELPALVARLRGEDMLIAIERAPPPERDTLSIGIAGNRFHGNLTSDTTRTDGFVIATDLAPTILGRYGLEVPEEMSGRPIRSEGERDAEAVADRAERMGVVAPRRDPVIVDNLIIWTALALLVALLARGRAPLALALLGLSTVYLPLLLLVGAVAETSELGERLIVGLGAPALAALTLRRRRGWEALAIACAITVGAYAIDVIAGSPLTPRSLLGPNPGLGVRFFGIGNELEAALSILTTAGVGAGLTALAQRREGAFELRTAAAAFIGVGAAMALIFAVGRFGADVGAAIVFPAGAGLAALALPGALRRRRLILGVVAAPLLALAALAGLDLALGGNAHLSRSVFEAGGADQLADVVERRLRLSASSFRGATDQQLFWFGILAAVAAVVFRRRILAWLAQVPAARAGLAGAVGATLVGIVANDSGALFVIIGAITLLACLAFAWAQHAGVDD